MRNKSTLDDKALQRIAQEFPVEGAATIPAAPTGLGIEIPGHGWYAFGPGSDQYLGYSKEDLVEMVLQVYEGSSGAGLGEYVESAEYWMQYPAIALLAIIGDTHGGGK